MKTLTAVAVVAAHLLLSPAFAQQGQPSMRGDGPVENVGAQTRSGRSHVLLIGPSCSYSTGGAGPGSVRVTSQICSTNVAFGDNDARTLFVAACDAVYKIRLMTPGILQGPKS
jgi:hypothetical protein